MFQRIFFITMQISYKHGRCGEYLKRRTREDGEDYYLCATCMMLVPESKVRKEVLFNEQ